MSAPLLSSLVPTAPGTRLTADQRVQRIEQVGAVKPLTSKLVGSTVIASPDSKQTHLAIPAEHWEWNQLRDYVISKINEIHGAVPRQAEYKEKAIFTGFINRHGAEQASRIAKYAFEVSGGFWKSAPISVNRFCAASDTYFAAVIARHLDEVAANS